MYPAIIQQIEKPNVQNIFPIPSFDKTFNLNESAHLSPQIINPLENPFIEMIKPLNFSEPFVPPP